MEKVTTLSEQAQNWLFTYGPGIASAILVLVAGMLIINWLARLVTKSLHRKNVDVSLQSFLASLVSVG
jgi:small conductance mechanosensitive channel